MSAAATDEDYAAAWKALPRRDRAELTQTAMRGIRSINRWDAAITLWWTQRELRLGLRRDVGVALIMVLGLIGFSWARTGEAPTSIADIFIATPLLPVFLLIPVVSSSMRRPKLRRSAQLNATILAGKTFESPPDPEEAERLLARAHQEGWFRGTRPERKPDS